MIDLLYIASASYSGSTLLTFLLAAHSGIATLGELKATSMGDVDQYRCSCGELIRRCAYWRRLAEELARRGIAFELGHFGTHFRLEKKDSLADRIVRAPLRGRLFEAARPLALRLLPGAPAEVHGILERNRLLIETACALRQANVFLDSSKEPSRLQYMMDSGLWRVSVVHLVRDGRGVTQSLLKRALRCQPELGERAPLIRRLARHWRRTNEACERVASRLPSTGRVTLRYEDVCREPQQAVATVLRLVSERPAALPADFRAIEHHILGNDMRLKSGRLQLDEAWRTALTAGDLAAFEREAGALNRRHGYL